MIDPDPLPAGSPILTALLDDPWSGGIQPLEMGFALGLLVLAAFSATASAVLLVHSPTKLSKRLGPNRGAALREYLDAHEEELRVLTRLLKISASIGCVVLAWQGVVGLLGNILFGLFCVLLALAVAVLPPAIAQREPERTVLRSLPILRPLVTLLAVPILRPLLAISRPLLRAARIPEQSPADLDELADDILAAVADKDPGNLAEEEREMIGNIVELKELHASEVMTPRTDIHALDASISLGEAIRYAVEKGHSRFPVYRVTIDNVVGVFYAKDVLSRFAHDLDVNSTSVGELLRDPLFAPETMRTSDLLREFKTSKVQMAIVIDEYGGTAGLVTIEDVLEEIVGEIEDEFDPEAEAPITIVSEGHVVEVAGKTRVEEANESLGSDLIPSDADYDTIGGFVFAHLEAIPAVGATFQAYGVEFEILAVEQRRVSRVRLTRLSEQPSDL